MRCRTRWGWPGLRFLLLFPRGVDSGFGRSPWPDRTPCHYVGRAKIRRAGRETLLEHTEKYDSRWRPRRTRAAIDRGQKERSPGTRCHTRTTAYRALLSSRSLQARTMVVDVLVKPGSTPLDELAITAAALWNGEQRPVRPEDLRLAFAPVRHMTVFDVVDAKLTLDVTATSAHGLWHCSFENRFELSSIAHRSYPTCGGCAKPDITARRTSGLP